MRFLAVAIATVVFFTDARAQQAFSVEQLLDRASMFVENLIVKLSRVVAEEQYVQEYLDSSIQGSRGTSVWARLFPSKCGSSAPDRSTKSEASRPTAVSASSRWERRKRFRSKLGLWREAGKASRSRIKSPRLQNARQRCRTAPGRPTSSNANRASRASCCRAPRF